jgi:hydroxymethylpyrimidine/phosphomethylpyrimidine kinase
MGVDVCRRVDRRVRWRACRSRKALLSFAAVPGRGRIRVCLSIAGSDSGGGAGIQADLKAFARAGVHGTTAITAITAQNTVGVTAVEAISPAMVVEQVRAVVEDIGVDAVKVGMLGSAVTAQAVGEAFDLLPEGTPIVVDPVMVAESGARLLDEDAQAALVELVVARATVVTPNVPEARVLAGDEALADADLARAVHALGPKAVVVTGGHREEAVDIVYDGERAIEIAGSRYADGAAHGSGCTHSATLAARLALGDDLESAAREAKRVASEAVRDGLRDIGAGAGPVDVLGLASRAMAGASERAAPQRGG